jgi:hypothetical protein
VSAPDATQLLMLPFNGSHASELKAVVAAAGSSKVIYGDTRGFFSTADSSDALHPYGYANIAYIAPKVASLVTPLLSLAPKSLVAAGGDQVVNLRWAALVGATNYVIKRGIVSGGPYSQVAMTTSTNYTDTAVTNGTAYFYVVSAAIAKGESSSSSEVDVTPRPPLQLTAAIDPVTGYLLLSWPSWATNGVLYSATNLTAPLQWQQSNHGPPQVRDARFLLDLPTTNAPSQFYLLKLP